MPIDDEGEDVEGVVHTRTHVPMNWAGKEGRGKKRCLKILVSTLRSLQYTVLGR